MTTRSAVLSSFVLAAAIAACTSGSVSTPAPTPTPPASPGPSDPPGSAQPGPVVSLEDAAARVIASDARFSGIRRQDRNLIGQGSWWDGRATASGYRIELEIGWGDCPAGCINRHQWSFDVGADGAITLVSETGDQLEGATG